jgi:hypothetical protein
MPPDGNELASGSPCESWEPENFSSTRSSPESCTLRSMKLSCFSAVSPVMGWNQWVKCVAPCAVAQSRATDAIASADFARQRRAVASVESSAA